MTTINVSWTAASDPSVGWNMYIRRNTASFVYDASFSPATRSTVLHNIQAGLYEVGVSRVEEETINGATVNVEGPISVIAIFVSDPVTVPAAPSALTGVVDPNAS